MSRGDGSQQRRARNRRAPALLSFPPNGDTYPPADGAWNRSPVLAILFRQDSVLASPISLSEMVDNRAAKAPPQSMMRIRQEGFEWTMRRVQSLP